MRWYCLPGLHGSSRPDNADGGSNFRAADGVGEGESVGREVRTETIGHGAGAITRTTIIETRTTPDGKTHTSRTVKESRGSSSDGAVSVQRPETGPAEQVRCFTLISSFFIIYQQVLRCYIRASQRVGHAHPSFVRNWCKSDAFLRGKGTRVIGQVAWFDMSLTYVNFKVLSRFPAAVGHPRDDQELWKWFLDSVAYPQGRVRGSNFPPLNLRFWMCVCTKYCPSCAPIVIKS